MQFPPYVCVVTIRGAVIVYQGSSYSQAALFLEPGTCYGRGATEQEALHAAQVQAGYFSARRMAG